MHEVGLMEDALGQAAAAARGAGAAHIQRLTFEVVDGGHVTRDVVETLFAALSPGTPAAGAEIEVVVTPGERWCLVCGVRFDGSACPACNGAGVLLNPAAELRLISIDVDANTAAGRAPAGAARAS